MINDALCLVVEYVSADVTWVLRNRLQFPNGNKLTSSSDIYALIRAGEDKQQ